MKEMEYQAERKIEILNTGNFFGLNYYILTLGTHPTAYIKIPEGHELYQKDFEEIYLEVHGGITYSKNYLYVSEDKKIDGWFIGWDYAHFKDYAGYYTEEYSRNLKKWTTQEIQDEVKEACYQIRNNELLKKDKIIDLMATQLVGLSMLDNDNDIVLILKTEEEVKKYFEGKIEDQHRIK